MTRISLAFAQKQALVLGNPGIRKSPICERVLHKIKFWITVRDLLNSFYLLVSELNNCELKVITFTVCRKSDSKSICCLLIESHQRVSCSWTCSCQSCCTPKKSIDTNFRWYDFKYDVCPTCKSAIYIVYLHNWIFLNHRLSHNCTNAHNLGRSDKKSWVYKA